MQGAQNEWRTSRDEAREDRRALEEGWETEAGDWGNRDLIYLLLFTPRVPTCP
jgi:hypothetical protein